MKGSRIHGIVRELRNENIDVINWSTNIQLMIQRSLTPAKITSIEMNTAGDHAKVFLRPEEVSKAIGRGGVNIKLASKMVACEIDVFRDNEEATEGEDFDIELQEFADEIDQWIIDALKGIGCDTAKDVLTLDEEELARRADLEEETIKEVVKILKSEFEKG
jgi:N utilization substance protein A